MDVEAEGDDAFSVVIGTRDVISIPPQARPLVQAHAEAHGFGSIADWLLWCLGDCAESVDEVREEIARVAKSSPIESALSILWSACRGEFFPWGMDPCPADVDTEEAYRARVDEWAQATPETSWSGEITEDDAVQLRAMAEAALRLDGKGAREIGDRLWEAWYEK